MGKLANLIVIILVFVLGFFLGSANTKEPQTDAEDTVKIEAIDKINVISVPERFKAEFPNKKAGFEFDIVTKVPSGSVELFKIKDKVDQHYHTNENHVLYILKGRAQGKVGDVEAEVKAGDLVIIPASVHHSLKNLEEEPLEFILFSTPAFNPDDIQFVK